MLLCAFQGDGQYYVAYEVPEEGFLAFYMQVTEHCEMIVYAMYGKYQFPFFIRSLTQNANSNSEYIMTITILIDIKVCHFM
jgi:hypothetical protein